MLKSHNYHILESKRNSKICRKARPLSIKQNGNYRLSEIIASNFLRSQNRETILFMTGRRILNHSIVVEEEFSV
jgi:hypothetical protein